MPKPQHSEAEARKEYMRQWRLKNAERIREQKRQWRLKNRESQREYLRQWRIENPELNREYQRKYDKKRTGRVRSEEQKKRDRQCNLKYMKNRRANDPIFREKERISAAKRLPAWRAANLQKLRLQKIMSEHRRRARKAAAENTFTKENWQTLLSYSKHCHWCKTPFTAKLRPTHDHVIPLSKGGGNTLANSCCACRPCNIRKQATLRNPITGQLILL